ncbi:hypothetical protein LIER_31679 [Lithospermum erythrorhizon]|uniref:Uncharacterized protein n=1 Tax=Lithospermum erythrorhizon TaxID=34254 RepID=A0AAV3RXM2_LITER
MPFTANTYTNRDELTKVVNKHINLENLQRKEGPSGDLREKFNRRDPQGPSKKTQIWDRLCDRGKTFEKDLIHPHAESWFVVLSLVHTSIWRAKIPLRVAISYIYSQMANKRLLSKPPRLRGQEGNRDKSRYYEYHREYGHDTD